MESEKDLTPKIQYSHKCEHCFCTVIIVNERKHLTCCMCGHRKLVEQVTF